MMNNRTATLAECVECDGFAYQCRAYTARDDEVCLWYEVVENDINKLVNGESYLTFPGLEEIMKKKE